jgi:hypothetical protein
MCPGCRRHGGEAEQPGVFLYRPEGSDTLVLDDQFSAVCCKLGGLIRRCVPLLWSRRCRIGRPPSPQPGPWNLNRLRKGRDGVLDNAGAIHDARPLPRLLQVRADGMCCCKHNARLITNLVCTLPHSPSYIPGLSDRLSSRVTAMGCTWPALCERASLPTRARLTDLTYSLLDKEAQSRLLDLLLAALEAGPCQVES